MSSNDTLLVLQRIKRKVARNRATYSRIYNNTTDPASKERARAEHAVCGDMIKVLNEEISKLFSPGKKKR